MINDKPIVLCICIDNLRPDRLGYYGNRIGTSDTIDQLMSQGINCENCYSNSNPTQFSYPYTFSSTKALDYGGYSNGVKDRPVTLPEIFSTNGYQTVGLSTSAYLEGSTGYERGFDQFYILFDMAENAWNQFAKVDLSFYYDLYSKGDIGRSEYSRYAKELCKETFSKMEGLCVKLQNDSNIYNKFYSKNKFLNKEHAFLSGLLVKEKLRMEAEGNSYFDNIHKYNNFYSFVENESGEQLPLYIKFRLMYSFICNLRVLSNKYLKLIFQIKSIHFATCDKIFNHVTSIIQSLRKSNNSKMFIWMHLLDVHDELYSKSPIHFTLKYPKILYNRFISIFKFTGINDLNMAYDLSITNIDYELSLFLDNLRRLGVINDVAIILYSDHGTNQGPPYRDRPCAGNFFEELTRVPFFIWTDNMSKETIKCTTTLADIIPTLCDLFKFDTNFKFEGISIFDKELCNRSVYIYEHTGRGPNDFKYKPIVVCVRVGFYKLIYKEFRFKSYINDLSENEFYCLNDDPSELNNIYHSKNSAEELKVMVKIAQQRIKDIRGGM